MNNTRVIFVIAAILLLFTALVVKLFNIQILRNEELKYLAERQQTKIEKIKAERGLIYDRNNILLAYNRNDVSFYVDLRMAGKLEKKKIAQKFSEVFGKPRQYYADLMIKGKTICLEKKAAGDKAFLMKDFKAAGLFSSEDPTRVYPYGSLASHLIGYLTTENQGANGVERSFEDFLNGTDGAMLVEKNALGDIITIEENETKPAESGENIYLTINKNYQTILEEELDSGLTAYGGSYALGIIMDPNTGEILAMANKGDYDPNTYWKYSDTLRRNKILTDTYEPGSTFKSITMAALLDQKLCREDEQVYIQNGRYKFYSAYITDSHTGPAFLTVKKVLEQSSNVGMSKLVQRIDNDLFYKYLRGFGFGNYTSIGLPGEEDGYLKKPNNWGVLTKAFMSFGYELSVTPIQLISAYSAIINGGILYQPQILKRRLSRNGIVVSENSPIPVRTVISKETSMKMREFLRAAVDSGTGKNARLKTVSVGGKTGTSQKLVNGVYSKSNYNSSFIGFFPVNDPKVICLILFNSPNRGRYGGLVAAPVFQKVAERITSTDPGKYFDIKSDKPEIINQNYTSTEKTKIIQISNKVTNDYSDVEFDPEVMPDLKNYTVREAINLLRRLGLKSKIEGSGYVISQSIPPGERIRKGSQCIIFCENSKINGAVIY